MEYLNWKTDVPTYGVKMIGSKKNLIPHILQSCQYLDINEKSLIDVFTGTTRVAQAFKYNGFEVQTCDLNWASEIYSNTFIGNNRDNTHLQSTIDELNNITPEVDWITDNYCDIQSNGNRVRVWQKKNGMKADAIRNKIEQWSLDSIDKSTLITSLIFALDQVDNTVGVQQAYLKEWCQRSYGDLKMVLPDVTPLPQGNHIMGDALSSYFKPAEIAYIDPPYTTHSYATYYHLWDSIAKWDKPEVKLKTNRRIDRTGGEKFDKNMRSSWNNRKQALNAFRTLVDHLPVRYVIISYNNEGIINVEEFMDFIHNYHVMQIDEVDYKRNVMSQIGNSIPDKQYNTKNKEYIVILKK